MRISRQEIERVRKFLGTAACLALLSVGPVVAAQQESNAQKPAATIDMEVLHQQVILDHLGFSPGVLDGRPGQSLTAALKGFQASRGLKVTGTADPATLAALQPHRGLRPVRHLRLTEDSLSGPFVHPLPKDAVDQGKLQSIGYRGPMEKLAEMFHTTPAVLRELNDPKAVLRPGTILVFPNALPTSRAYAADLKPDWRKTLNDLNISADQPEAARIVVDRSDKVLKVYDKDDRLVAQFSATMGSKHDPLPIGRWKIQGADYNPKFHYNPELFWDVSNDEEKVLLPAGPNGPVGVVWLDLNKPHYGIHGTPEPHTIGRAESHGCIRLTNWDAARLAMMVKPGTPAVFQE
jgi:lipoprotein-anchoring transpeptidase ErfK/SrfK